MSDSVKSLLCKIFSVFNMMILIVIIIYHFYTTHKHHGLKFHQCPTSLLSSFILLIFSMWSIIGQIIQTFDRIQSDNFCNIIRIVCGPSYILFKCTIYLILVFRLKESFKGTAYSHKSLPLLLWTILVIIWSLLNMFAVQFISTSHLDLQSVPVCGQTHGLFIKISLPLLDIIAFIINSYLFIKPVIKIRTKLKSLQQSGNNMETEKFSNDLKTVAIKQCILSLIAIGTTFLTLICAARLGMKPWFIPTDINISILCIIFIYKWNSYIVKRMLCCCLQSTEDINNLELTIASNTSTSRTAVGSTSKSTNHSEKHEITIV